MQISFLFKRNLELTTKWFDRDLKNVSTNFTRGKLLILQGWFKGKPIFSKQLEFMHLILPTPLIHIFISIAYVNVVATFNTKKKLPTNYKCTYLEINTATLVVNNFTCKNPKAIPFDLPLPFENRQHNLQNTLSALQFLTHPLHSCRFIDSYIQLLTFIEMYSRSSFCCWQIHAACL